MPRLIYLFVFIAFLSTLCACQAPSPMATQPNSGGGVIDASGGNLLGASSEELQMTVEQLPQRLQRALYRLPVFLPYFLIENKEIRRSSFYEPPSERDLKNGFFKLVSERKIYTTTGLSSPDTSESSEDMEYWGDRETKSDIAYGRILNASTDDEWAFALQLSNPFYLPGLGRHVLPFNLRKIQENYKEFRLQMVTPIQEGSFLSSLTRDERELLKKIILGILNGTSTQNEKAYDLYSRGGIKIQFQNEDCHSDSGSKDASAKVSGEICMSSNALARLHRSQLSLQSLGLAFHELAHVYGFGEKEAQLLQAFIVEQAGKTLMISNSRKIITLMGSLSAILNGAEAYTFCSDKYLVHTNHPSLQNYFKCSQPAAVSIRAGLEKLPIDWPEISASFDKVKDLSAEDLSFVFSFEAFRLMNSPERKFLDLNLKGMNESDENESLVIPEAAQGELKKLKEFIGQWISFFQGQRLEESEIEKYTSLQLLNVVEFDETSVHGDKAVLLRAIPR